MDTHTPKPWIKSRNLIETAAGDIIATVSYEQAGYVQANGTLIAAAPDLLAACKDFLRALDWMTVEDFSQAATRPYRVAMEAAIAKAEGY